MGLRLSAHDPLLAPILADSERVICAEGCDRDDLLALGQALGMAEYIAFPLGGEPQQPHGVLIAETQRIIQRTTHIFARIANLWSASQTSSRRLRRRSS